jgi:hypothetical protein
LELPPPTTTTSKIVSANGSSNPNHQFRIPSILRRVVKTQPAEVHRLAPPLRRNHEWRTQDGYRSVRGLELAAA